MVDKRTIARKKFLLELCHELDVDMRYFVDPVTGILKQGVETMCSLRMQELGIYSWAELERRLSFDNIRTIIKRLDAQAAAENQELRELVDHQD